ncbi:MAG: alpha/beta hydrolase [Simkania sp.]|nr:alpha/beta hydrolase [Simkania sp.]
MNYCIVACYALFLLVSFPSISLFAERDNISITREDGSLIQGILDFPDSEKDFPLVIFIDGSHENSVTGNHEKLASLCNAHKIGFLSIEKRGITPKGIDKKEFIAHDCAEERLSDYALLLKQFRVGKIARGNGCCILLGASEGGKIAPQLALAFPSVVQGVVLISSGGGISFAEEMKYQTRQHIRQSNVLRRLGFKIRGVIFPEEEDKYYKKILEMPESLKMYRTKTWKWWASYLRQDLLSTLLKIDMPMYMIHGAKDVIIPVKSADRVKEAFDKAGKTNFEYARYEDLGHALTGREDVYASMMEWIQHTSAQSAQRGLEQ